VVKLSFLNKVVQGDALELLKKLPDESVDMVFTDPPYFIQEQVVIHRSMNPKKYKYVGRDIVSGGWSWDNQWKSEEDYLMWTWEWYKEAVRCLRVGGHMVVFFDRLRQYWLWHFGERLNMKTRQPLYFILTNPVPRARKVDFMGAVYSIFWQTKGTYSRKHAVFNYELGQHPNYIEVPITPTPTDRPRHPTEKHEKVAEWLIKYLTKEGEVILDPFTGSGTIPYVAKNLRRNFIAFEIDQNWVVVAQKRIESIQTQEITQFVA
jgi:DNA modification methylase